MIPTPVIYIYILEYQSLSTTKRQQFFANLQHVYDSRHHESIYFIINILVNASPFLKKGSITDIFLYCKIFVFKAGLDRHNVQLQCVELFKLY